VRRQPNQQFEEKEQLQAKNLPDRTLKDSLNKELRLQHNSTRKRKANRFRLKKFPLRLPKFPQKRNCAYNRSRSKRKANRFKLKKFPLRLPKFP
jgi:hypothetical protein